MPTLRDGEALAGGRREHRKHVTRRELLLAGRRLFSARGLYEARIEDLTSTADIAKGTLYGYFASKEELIRAVVDEGFGELLEAVRRAAREARSPEDVLACGARAHLEFFAAQPDLMRVLHQARGMLKFDRPEWRSLRVSLGLYLGRLGDVLAAAPGGPSLGAAERLELAGVLFGALSGAASVRASLKPRAPRLPGQEAVVQGAVALVVAFRTRRRARGARGAARHAARRGRPMRTDEAGGAGA